MIGDTLQSVINLLTNAGYKVKTHPDEVTRPNEVYVDVEDINVSEEFTGGITVSVTIAVTLIRVDRIELLNDIESVIKVVDLPNLKFERCLCDHDGEAVIVTLMFSYREVIYFE